MKKLKDWQCMECGTRMTLKQAEQSSYSAEGCPNCGGADIDLYSPSRQSQIARAVYLEEDGR
jgi:predicted  nucleic acid-binding Zn-ribbon protein